MASPLERLQKIVAAYTPTEVVYIPDFLNKESFSIKAIVSKPGKKKVVPEDIELQQKLEPQLREYYNKAKGCWQIDVTESSLWNFIRCEVAQTYRDKSSRCAATKKKTINFIHSIELTNVHLANYVLKVFSKAALASDFEAFEALRRNYGKSR